MIVHLRRVMTFPAVRYGVLVLLWSLYPLLFTMSRNWYALTPPQIWFLFLVVPASCVSIYGAVGLLLAAARSLLKRLGHRDSHAKGWFALGAVGVIVATVYVLLHATLLAVLDKDVWILLIFISIGICIYFVLMKGKFNIVLLISLALISFAGGEWIYNILATDGTIGRASEIARRTGFSEGETQISFMQKPNIYLIMYDGYGNDSALRTIYDINNEELYSKLEKSQFIVLRDALSNYQITWPTMLAFFLANHHFYDISWSVDDSSVGRLITNGRALNPVFSVFERNGYKIQFINRDNYFGVTGGSIDYYFPVSKKWNAFDIFESPYLKFLHVGRDRRVNNWHAQRDMLDRRIELAAADSSPWFTFSYVYYPGHADRKKTWAELGDYVGRYRDRFQEANQHLLHIVEKIRSLDPEAFIILMGDHGGWRYIKSWTADGVDDANEAFEINSVSVQTVTLDVFGILLAIDTGGRCDEYFYETITPVNLMRALFSCLSGQDLLSGRPKDSGFFYAPVGGKRRKYMTIDSGRILERWRPFTQQMRIDAGGAPQ